MCCVTLILRNMLNILAATPNVELLPRNLNFKLQHFYVQKIYITVSWSSVKILGSSNWFMSNIFTLKISYWSDVLILKLKHCVCCLSGGTADHRRQIHCSTFLTNSCYRQHDISDPHFLSVNTKCTSNTS